MGIYEDLMVFHFVFLVLPISSWYFDCLRCRQTVVVDDAGQGRKRSRSGAFLLGRPWSQIQGASPASDEETMAS
jgi:hypothetical protein